MFLFSSLTETLGLVVLEAMAAGLPVVATPAGGVADHLRDEENGIAVGANDVDAMARAIVSLAMDAGRRRRLAAGARLTALSLDWNAGAWIDLTRAIVRCSKRAERGQRTTRPRDIFEERAARGAIY